MQFQLSESAEEQYIKLLPALQKAAQKQFDHLVRDLRHPSLRTKKYDETLGLWQARINASWRFYFFIKSDTYYIVSIRKHTK